MPVESVTVGSVEIARVSDGVMTGPPAFFFSGIPPSMYEQALGDDLRSDGMIDVEFGSFVVRSSGKTILVDTGMGNKRGAPGGLLPGNLKKIGLAPEDIDVVFNTHLHIDHVGWNCSERDGVFVPTFPNAEYWVAEKEWDFWTGDPDLVTEEGRYLTSDVLPLRDSPQLKLVGGNPRSRQKSACCQRLAIRPDTARSPSRLQAKRLSSWAI